jgi:shikimate kinase
MIERGAGAATDETDGPPAARRRHLALVGLMGAGKSVVGRACAERLGVELLDTDALVVESAGASVAGIFAAEGERGFRVRESQAVVEACSHPTRAVIACGGGAVLDPESRRVLRERCIVVWLTASSEELARRVGGDLDRPLLQGPIHPVARLSALARDRDEAYSSAAHVEVDAAAGDVAAVADAVLAAYRRLDRRLPAPGSGAPRGRR